MVPDNCGVLSGLESIESQKQTTLTAYLTNGVVLEPVGTLFCGDTMIDEGTKSCRDYCVAGSLQPINVTKRESTGCITVFQ